MYKPGWLLFCSLLLAYLCQGAGAMSVDEAYAAIPHPRTDFNRHDTGITSGEAACLDALFELVNTAIVFKVEALNRLAGNVREGNSLTEYQAGIDTILASLQQLQVPDRLRSVHKLVTASIQQQSDYFHDWALRSAAGEHFSFNAADDRVAAAHRDLITAYNLLMQLYPQAGKENRNAFYNHLCALDFI